MNFNLCLCGFDESAVRQWLPTATGLSLTELPAPPSPQDMRLPVQAGGALPAIGHFYRPLSNPQLLLFTSSSGDGWPTPLHRLSQHLLDASVPAPGAAPGPSHCPSRSPEGCPAAHRPSEAGAARLATFTLAPASFIGFRVSAKPLLMAFALHRGLHTQRLARVMDDGRQRLDWLALGEPLSLEDTARYSARRKRDRLDLALLRQYARALGLDGLSEADFCTTAPSLRVTETWSPAG